MRKSTELASLRRGDPPTAAAYPGLPGGGGGGGDSAEDPRADPAPPPRAGGGEGGPPPAKGGGDGGRTGPTTEDGRGSESVNVRPARTWSATPLCRAPLLLGLRMKSIPTPQNFIFLFFFFFFFLEISVSCLISFFFFMAFPNASLC